MNTYEIIEHVVDGKVLINLPDEYNNKKVKITVLSQDDSKITQEELRDEENWSKLPGVKRGEILKRFFGTAKYPDFPITKYDVYDQ